MNKKIPMMIKVLMRGLNEEIKVSNSIRIPFMLEIERKGRSILKARREERLIPY
jgi:hypothetical protein